MARREPGAVRPIAVADRASRLAHEPRDATERALTSYEIFEYAGILSGCAGLVMAVMGAFHRSRLPLRPRWSPPVPEHVVAFVLLATCTVCNLLSGPLDDASPWRLAVGLALAALFLGLAAHAYVRSRRGPAR